MEKVPLVLLLQVNENASRNLWLLHSLLVLADGHPCNGQNRFIFCDKIVTFRSLVLAMDQNLQMYIKTLSNLTGCLQFMRGSETYEGDEDSDEEEIKETLYKAENRIWKSFCFL